MAGKKKTAEKVASNELVLSTETFKTLVSKAYKGVGNNKLLPLTQLICIQAKGGTLQLITMDSTGTNYLYVKQAGVDGDFYVTVLADQFAKLVGKLTCDKVTLQVDNDKLKVKGNGEYIIALQYDEMGNSIQYPDPVTELGDATEDTQTVSSSAIGRIINSVKPALAVTLEAPYLTGYYVGDKVFGTDGDVISSYNVPILKTPALISPIVFDLVALSDAESISIDRYEDGVIVFSAPDVIVYSHEMDGIQDYPVSQLQEYIDSDMDNSCKLPKSTFLQALDRLSLFIGEYDDDEVRLGFTGKALTLSSRTSTGVEDVTYVSGDKAGDFDCGTVLPQLVKALKTQSTDSVELQYGDDTAIKFVDGDVTQILCLMDDTAVEE